MRRYAAASLFAAAVVWGAVALFLVLRLGPFLLSDSAAVFAVTLAVLLAAAFLLAARRRADLSTLKFFEDGGELERGARIVRWRWSDATASFCSPDYFLFDLAYSTIEIPLKLFQNHAALAEYLAAAPLPEPGFTQGTVRLANRVRARDFFSALPFFVVLLCAPVYMDFAGRVLVDCGVPAVRGILSPPALAVLLGGAIFARWLWLEIPSYGAGVLACSLYLAAIAGMQHPLYLNAARWRVTAFWAGILGIACGVALWVMRRERVRVQ